MNTAMKKILAVAGALALGLAPGLALAAYNDVSLDSTVVLNIGSIVVDVTGSTNTIESITVDSGSFSVNVQPNSTLKVTAPNLNQLNASFASTIPATITCTGSESSVSFTSNAGETITFTPSSTACSDSTSSGSGGGNGAPAGGGGGGASVIVAPIAVGTSKSATTAQSSSAVAALQAQLNALLAQIAMLKGGPAMAMIGSFAKDLQIGSTGADAKSLQMYLNGHGYMVASSGAGSPGNETMKFGGATKAALIKFQKAVGISPASGYFGPKTRAYVAAHP